MVGATDRKSVGWVFELAKHVRITLRRRQLGEDSGRIVLELNAQRSRMGHTPDYRNRIQLFTAIENSGKRRIQEGVEVQRLNGSDKVRRRPVGGYANQTVAFVKRRACGRETVSLSTGIAISH
jgi:hypothetical protein